MNSETIFSYVFLLPTYIITHLLIYNTQFISAREYFYGVYIKNIEIEKEHKNKIDKSFKRKVNILFLFVVITFILNQTVFNLNEGIVLTVTLIIYLLGAYINLKSSYEEVKILKEEYLLKHLEEKETLKVKNRRLAIDTEFLKEKDKIKRKFTKLFGICITLSIISFIYLAINYNNLPEIIPTHWGANGEADAFSEKNIMSTFFISFIDISMVILMAFLGIGTIGSRIYLDTKDLEKNRKRALRYLNNLGYGFFILTLSIQSVTTTIPYYMVNEKPIPIAFTLITLFIPMIIILPIIYSFAMLSSLKSKEKYSNSTESDDERWIYGFIYYNKEDPAFLVEKRFGAGWTFNMAHIKSKLILGLLFIITFGSLMILLF